MFQIGNPNSLLLILLCLLVIRDLFPVPDIIQFIQYLASHFTPYYKWLDSAHKDLKQAPDSFRGLLLVFVLLEDLLKITF